MKFHVFRVNFTTALNTVPELGLDVDHLLDWHVLKVDADGRLREEVGVDVHVRGQGLVGVDKGLHHRADLRNAREGRSGKILAY